MTKSPIALRFPHLISEIASSPLYRQIHWKTAGVLLGVLLFIGHQFSAVFGFQCDETID
jgi:hypothetical protein